MKIAIILVGEAFRKGGQGNRSRDLPESYELQKKACESHVALAEKLERSGVFSNFFIETYSTVHEKDLRSWYGKRMISLSMENELRGLEFLASKGLSKCIEDYDCFFVCRVDLMLKEMFFEVFDPCWEKVMFPFVCWINHHRHAKFPRISDTMMFIPKKMAPRVLKKLCLSHQAWFDYVSSKILGEDELGVMIDTFHDSDSAKDYNPLYSIANRRACEFWHSVGYVAGPDLEPVETEERKRFPDWSPSNLIPKKMDPSVEMWEWWHKDPNSTKFRFISLVGFSKHEVFGQKIEYYNHRDQRYWAEDGDSILIFDEDRKVSSRLNRLSEKEYSGPYEFVNGVLFKIKKFELSNWI